VNQRLKNNLIVTGWLIVIAVGFTFIAASIINRPVPPKPVCRLEYKPGTKVTVIDGDFGGMVGTITNTTTDRCGYIVQIKNRWYYQGQTSPFIKKGNVLEVLNK
jgi:transcription antitermination factor NusG